MLSLGLSLWGANAVAVTPLLPGEFRPPRFTDADAFGALTIGVVAPQALSMPEVSDGDSFGALTLAATTPQALTFGAFTDADTFDELIVGAESLDIFLSEFVDDDTFHAFSVGVASGQSLTFGAFADADSFGASTIAKATPQALTMPAFTDADTFGATEVWYGLLLEFDGVDTVETSDIGERTFDVVGYTPAFGEVTGLRPLSGPVRLGAYEITPDDDDMPDGSFISVTSPKFTGIPPFTVVSRTWVLDDVAVAAGSDPYQVDREQDGGLVLFHRTIIEDATGQVTFETPGLTIPEPTELPVTVTNIGDGTATYSYTGAPITLEYNGTVQVTAGDTTATYEEG